MLSAFSKPIELVTAADIAEIISEGWPEGPDVEFKRSLSQRSGQTHPWYAGGENIGDHARDEILAELVAFANALGGSLLLGIEETKAKPPRAQNIAPLPRVGDLARRFEDQARSGIEPPLGRLQIQAIETDRSGGGVILFRTGPSRLAPHRVSGTRESYVRRGSSSVRMTMREIQDMSLNVARGLAGIDASFRERKVDFVQWLYRQRGAALGCRATAIPLIELPDPGRLFGVANVFPHHAKIDVTQQNSRTSLLVGPSSYQDRPRLRGIERRHQTECGAIQWEFYQTGLTDYWLALGERTFDPAAPKDTPKSWFIRHEEVLEVAVNSLYALDRFRSLVGAPDAEYGLEVEIFSTIGNPIIYTSVMVAPGTYKLQIPRLPILLPRLSVGSRDTFNELIGVIHADLYDALEISTKDVPRLDIDISTP